MGYLFSGRDSQGIVNYLLYLSKYATCCLVLLIFVFSTDQTQAQSSIDKRINETIDITSTQLVKEKDGLSYFELNQKAFNQDETDNLKIYYPNSNVELAFEKNSNEASASFIIAVPTMLYSDELVLSLRNYTLESEVSPSSPIKEINKSARTSCDSPSSTSLTLNWVGGHCTVCTPGNEYACNTNPDYFTDWNNGDRTFTDPLPAGAEVSSISITVFGVHGCGGGNDVQVELNGTNIGSSTMGGSCGCDTCFDTNITASWDDCGEPSFYTYGGLNTINLSSAGVMCIDRAEMTIEYCTDVDADISIVCPPTLNIECGDPNETTLITNWLNSVDVVGDDAGVSFTNTYSPAGFSDGCSDTGNQTVSFTATNSCGEDMCSALLRIRDLQAPVPNPAPANASYACDTDVPAAQNLSANDQCDGMMSVAPTESITANTCLNKYTLTRTWTFTDECGNTASTSQIITVDDNVNPTLPVIPADLTIACVDDEPAAVSLTAIDNCDGNITVAPIENTVIGDCATDYIKTRTWTFTDVCGNTSMASQTITVEDPAPSITCPADLILECADPNNDALIADWLSTVTGSDLCGDDITISHNYDPDGFSMVEEPTTNYLKGFFNIGLASTKWLADHLLSLSNIETEKLKNTPQKNETQQNNEKPTIKPTNSPSTSLMECGCTATQGDQEFDITAIQNAEDDVAFYQYGTPDGASSNTGLELNNHVTLFLYENTLTGEISLFVIIDAAGGGDGGNGTIDFYCLPSSATLDFSDDPGEISGIFPTVTANWRWANCCTDGALIGNVGCETTFDFYPNFPVGIDAIRWASGDLADPDYFTFDSSDEPVRIQCGDSQPSCCPNENEVDITNVECPGDNNGAIDLTVDPTSAPYTFEWSTGATTEDISGLTNDTYTVTIVDDNDCEQIIDIEVEVDSDTPMLVCPSNLTINLDEDDEATLSLADLNVSVDYDCDEDDYTVECENCASYDCDDQNTTKTINVTLSDILDNEDECSIQVFINNDAPNITCPDDLTLECADPENDDMISTWLASASATDPEGGTVNITNTYDEDDFAFRTIETEFEVFNTSGKQNAQLPAHHKYLKYINSGSKSSSLGGDGTGTQEVTFTATDGCGNMTSCTAMIIIDDTTRPVLSCPADIANIEGCEASAINSETSLDFSTAWVTVTEAQLVAEGCSVTEDCNLSLLRYRDIVSTEACAQEIRVRRLWWARDACLNTAITCSQYFDIEDTTNPMITCPTDIEGLTCNVDEAPVPAANITAYLALDGASGSDNCSANADLMLSSVDNPDPASDDFCTGTNTIITRSYTISDECGNMASCEQIITFTVPGGVPFISCPVTLEVEGCEDTDVASESLALSLVELEITEAVFAGLGGDAESACEIEEITYQDEVLVDMDCANDLSIIRTFTASDKCDYSVMCHQLIHINDETAPTVNGNCTNPNALPDVVLSLNEDDCMFNYNDYSINLATLGLSASDNCGAAVELLDETVRFSCADIGLAEFEIRVVDCSGNISDPKVCSVNVTKNEDLANWTNQSPICEAGNIDLKTWLDVGSTNCGEWTGDNVASNGIFDARDPGVYTVTYLVGDNSCNIFRTHTIEVFPAVNAVIDNVEACVDNNMQVDLTSMFRSTTTGGGIFSFVGVVPAGVSLNGDIVTFTEAGIVRVQYEVGNEDVGGLCYRTDEAWLRMYESPGINPIAAENESCENENDGSINISITGGNAPITYEWSNAATTQDISGLSPDYYTVTVTNRWGCSSTAQYQILEAYEMVVDIVQVTNASCSDGTDGSVEIDADGGLVPYDFDFSDGAANDVNNNAGNVIAENLSPGNYSVSVTDDNGCEEILNFTIGSDPNPVATLNDLAFPCDESPNGSISLSSLFGTNTTAGGSFSLVSFSGPGAFGSVTGNTLSYGGPGCYEIKYDVAAYEGATGDCAADDTAFIQIAESPQAMFSIQDQVCWSAGDDPLLHDYTPLVNSPTYISGAPTTTWTVVSGPATLDNPSTGQISITGTGTVILRLEESISAAACGSMPATVCTSVYEQAINVQDGTSLDASFTVDNTTPCIGDVVNFTPATPGGVFNALGLVDDGAGTGASFTVPSCGVFAISYTLNSSNGCTNTYTYNLQTDQEIPSITAPDDITVECGSAYLEWFTEVVADDNCEVVITNELVSDDATCGNTFRWIYEFTAIDECGNTASDFATYTVLDEIAPSFTSMAGTLTIECNPAIQMALIEDWIADNGGATATDICGELTWTHEYSIDPATLEGCGFSSMFEVDFTVTDECGNSNTTRGTVIIEDTTAPSITCPDNISIECGSDNQEVIITNWLANVAAVDNCETVILLANDYNEEFTAACGSTGTYTVSFTATDDCDNESECEATISIEDNIAPAFVIAPQDLYLECDGSGNLADIAIWLANNGDATAFDQCDNTISWSNAELSDETICGDATVLSYTFIITDDCLNASSQTAQVFIEDASGPSLTVPMDHVDECNDISLSLADWLAQAESEDVCGSAAITSQLWNTISACGGTSEEIYLFTATDDCGNETTGLASYSTIDTAEPTITCPAELIIECGNLNNDQIIANWLTTATAVDANNCSDVTIENTSPGSLPALDCDLASGLMITFTATDQCGNSDDCSVLIKMEDTSAPGFVNCPTDMTVNVDVDLCESNVIYSIPVAVDACDDNLEINLIDGPASGTSFELGTTNVSYEAIDDCDNATECSFSITVEDSGIPTVLCPTNQVVVCTDNGLCTWLSDDQTDPLFNENCDGLNLTYTVSGETIANSAGSGTNTVTADNLVFNLGTSTIEYTIEDASGNEANCSFNVIVEDCEDPNLSCSDLLNVPCGLEDVDAWTASISGTMTDNCSGEITLESKMLTDISSCGNTFERVYEFTAIDAAGNQSSCIARYETDDLVSPTIDTPASDQTVECTAGNENAALLAWLNNSAGAAASDACSGPISWTNNYTGGLTSVCGSTSFVDVVFTATDDCGNSNTTAARFTIEDTTDPTIVCPTDITLECAFANNESIIENWLTSAIATDNCSSDLEIMNDYGAVFEAACNNTGVHRVTFSISDDCFNGANCEALITIQDTSSPNIVKEASDLVLTCNDPNNIISIAFWLGNHGGALANDPCSGTDNIDETWTYEEIESNIICGNTTTTLYTFTIEDDCGNTSSTSASIILEDTTPPVLSLPADELQVCGAINKTVAAWIAEASAVDECGNVSITATLWNTINECGNTFTEVYLFTATDACGNESTGFANYGTEDTAAPTINCPAELSIECGSDNNDQIVAAWLNLATATDANDCNDVSITSTDPGSLPVLDCDLVSGLSVTFTATDDCGNASDCSSIIKMTDSTPPVFINCPLDMTLNVDVDLCERNVIYSIPAAIDACDDNLTISLVDGPASGSSFELGTTNVSYEATDDCDNTSECSFTITIEDSDIPAITCPSNQVLVCTDIGLCTWLSDDQTDPLFNENCDGLTLTYTISGETTANSAGSGTNTVAGDNVVFNLGISTVEYTIEDASGNSANCSFKINVEDCENPQLTCSDLLNVPCGLEDVAAWTADIEATMTDNCAAALSLETLMITDLSSCGNTFERVYQFTAVDAAGNRNSCTARYETDDTVSPSIDTPASNETIECTGDTENAALLAWLNNAGGAVASDVCSGPISWTNNYTDRLTTVCGSTAFVDVVFTATDACGNTNSTAARFTIEDTTDPGIVCPNDITLECAFTNNESTIQNWLTGASATDNCATDLEINHDYGAVYEAACNNTGIHRVTFSVTDDCANGNSCEALITIEDTSAPIIMEHAEDLVLECSDPNNNISIAFWLANHGGALAHDPCSETMNIDELWSFEEIESSIICGNTTSTAYTFTIEDECGNATTTSASIVLEDTTPPSLSLPADEVQVCGASTKSVSEWIAEAMAEDDCGNASISATLWNTISACGNNYTEVYLFTATDDCGNETTGFANYGTEDTDAPSISCPADLTIECGSPTNDQMIAAWLNSASAEDANDCNDVSISSTDPGTLPDLDCDLVDGLTVTFTATDDCGNSTDCSALIKMEDTTAPNFVNCPADMTVNVDVDLCESNVIYSTPVAIDRCDDNLAITLIDGPASGTSFELGTTTVTFEAIDDCDNTSECSFNITVEDSGVPSVSCPSNQVVVCTDLGECTWLSDDQTDPLFNENCDGLILTYEITGETLASSAASGTNTIEGDNIVFNLGTSSIQYTIEDGSGNSSSCNFRVIVEDCEDPQLICTDVLDVACGLEDITAWTASIAASMTDNCDGGVSLETLMLTDISSCGNTFERVYEFTAIDAAGNRSSCTARYETDDTVSPSIDTPAANETIECTGTTENAALLAWLNNVGGAAASDECSGPISWTNNYTGGLTAVCGSTSFVDVIFTATDDCGNTNSTSARFTIEDTTDPVIVCPNDITLECALTNNPAIIENWLRGATATDNCATDLAVNNDYGAVFEAACNSTGIHRVTFSVTDDCSNGTSCEALITIEDTSSPTIVAEAEDLVLECSDPNNAISIAFWLANHGGALANDPCSGTENIDMTWTYEEIESVVVCGTATTTAYRFTIEDDCGNTSTTTANISIVDTTPPSLTVPSDEIQICGQITKTVDEWLAEATGDDECGGVDITSTLWNTISACGENQIEVYLFSATDACGNETTGFAQYELIDNVNPLITKEAENFTVECDGSNNSIDILNWLNNNGFAEATDNCGDLSWSNNFGSIATDCGASGGVTVTFTATDECGNVSTTEALFNINDTTAPTWEVDPVDLVLECSSSSNLPAALNQWLNASGYGDAEDDCSLISYTHDYTEYTEDCSGATGGVMVTFTATDACGNSSERMAMLTIVDTSPPLLKTPALNTTVECDGAGNEAALQAWLDNHAGATMTDLCGDVIWETPILIETRTLCGATLEHTYSFTTKDACDNQSVATVATFIIEDTTSPSLEVEAEDMTVQCDGGDYEALMETWINTQGGAMVADDCSSYTWTHYLVGDNEDCPMTGTGIYRFVATDDCGNEVSTEAVFQVIDIIPPMITNEAQDLSIDCGSDNVLSLIDWLNNNASASATDECGLLSWTNNYGSQDMTCGEAGTIMVTFTVSDGCGNTSETSATLTINDNTAPTWNIEPQDLIIECNDTDDPMQLIAQWLERAGNGDAKDECSMVMYHHDFVALEDACGSASTTGTANVTFTATDACGNFVESIANVTVKDETPPMIDSPARNMEVACDGGGNIDQLQAWLAMQANAVSSDRCGEITWNNPILITTNEDCGGTLEHIFSFTSRDACGNVSAATEASFIIYDHDDPIIEVAASEMTVDCDNTGAYEIAMDEWINTQGGAIASDVCGGVSWTYDLVRANTDCDMTGAGTYRFTATDDCGNTSITEAEFIIRDITAPNIVGGADMNMEECQPSGSNGNYPDFDYWLDNHAGAEVMDECSAVSWTHDYNPDNWVYTCGNSRYIDVEFTATDGCGNASSVSYNFAIGDNTPPYFINCPRPPIVEANLDGYCDAFANFSYPFALDNCTGAIVTQVDNTGLTSGSLFPVGTTVLQFEASDDCGNVSACELSIVVNDFRSEPEIVECPADIHREADQSSCGAQIALSDQLVIEDNCPDNISVLWEVVDGQGNTVACALGNGVDQLTFPTGTHTVNIFVQDQARFLISEVLQSGLDQITLTNYGPATLDISNLQIDRFGLGAENFNVPVGTLVAVGASYVHTFTNDLMLSDPASYQISFLGRTLDEVATNGATSANWSGSLNGGDVYRKFACDHNTASDWNIYVNCVDVVGGLPLPLMEDNGGQTSLQAEEPSIVEKSFTITIDDNSLPTCASIAPMTSNTGANRLIDPNTCVSSVVNISSGFTLDYLQLSNVEIDHPSIEDLTAYLVSPNGTSIQLFSGVCPGESDLFVQLSDTTSTAISAADCATISDGLWYQPNEAFNTFSGESSNGNWSFVIQNSGPNPGYLTNWTLDLYEFTAYAPMDVVIEVAGPVGATLDVQHPFFNDNCCQGSVTMSTIAANGLPDNNDPVIAGSMQPYFFHNGSNVVSYELEDCDGNATFCDFNVTVLDTLAPPCMSDCQISCLGDIQISLTYDCEREILPSLVGIGIDEDCDDYYMIELFDAWSNPLPSNVVTAEHIGQIITYKVTEPVCGNSCWGEATVEYKLAPQIECPDDFVVQCQENYELDESIIAISSCLPVELVKINEVPSNIECEDEIRQIVYSYVAKDSQGKLSPSCSFVVAFERITVEEIMCPADFLDADDTALMCSHEIPSDENGHPVPYDEATGLGTGLPTILDDAGLPIDLNPETSIALCNLEIAYSDLVVPTPNCFYKLMRTWTIREWHCLGEIDTMCTQVIEIRSEGGFELNCPDNYQVSTNMIDCEAMLNLPAAIIDDECSSTINFIVDYGLGILNTNGGAVTLEAGTHIIEYFAFDNCDNEDECTVEITVVDQAAPLASCKSNLVIALNSTGVASVSATEIDNDSYDDCDIDRMAIRRLNDNCGEAEDLVFGSSVSICCADAGSDVSLVLGVWDVSDNFNECTALVEIQDKVEPTMICQDDVTIDCSDIVDLSDLSTTFGMPSSADNCGNIVMEESVEDLRNACGAGNLIRTIQLKDGSNIVQTCEQTITAENNSPFVYEDIIWPMDLTTSDVCDVAALDPDELAEDFASPQTENEACAQLSYSYTDEVFEFVDDEAACFKILRTWTAINACPATPGDISQWEHEQTLKMTNSIAPVIASCEEMIEFINDVDCDDMNITFGVTATDDCTPVGDLLWMYELDMGNDGSIDASGSSATITGDFAIGEHFVSWQVEDGCGNVDVCSQTIEIVSGKGPNAVCKSGLTVSLTAMDLDGDGNNEVEMAFVMAESLDGGSFHTCMYDLVFSFSEDVLDTLATFDCDDIGTNPTTLFVTDEQGIQSQCETMIIVQDTNDEEICPPTLMVDVQGRIATENDKIVEDVEVYLMSDEIMELTDEEGIYSFGDMPLGGSYIIKPTYDYHPLNGVSTLDIVIIQRHILGIKPLETSYQLIAADANNSEQITSSDLLDIRRLILGLADRFTDNTSWRFVDAEQTFLDPNDPWSSGIDETYAIALLDQFMWIDFVGVKTGDVNGSVMAFNGETEVRSNEDIYIKYEKVVDQLSFKVTEDLSMAGLQYSMFVGDVDLVDLECSLAGFNDSNVSLVDGILRVSYAPEALVSLKEGEQLFSFKFSEKLKDVDLVNKLNAELYEGDDLVIRNIKLEEAKLSTGLKNYPNPWTNNTTIEFESDTNQEVALSFYNNSGQLEFKTQVSLVAGINKIKINKELFNAGGVKNYRLVLDNGTVLYGKTYLIE